MEQANKQITVIVVDDNRSQSGNSIELRSLKSLPYQVRYQRLEDIPMSVLKPIARPKPTQVVKRNHHFTTHKPSTNKVFYRCHQKK